MALICWRVSSSDCDGRGGDGDGDGADAWSRIVVVDSDREGEGKVYLVRESTYSEEFGSSCGRSCHPEIGLRKRESRGEKIVV
jgi:hypothetical protein